MKMEDFQAGVWKRQYQFKAFSPSLINQQWTWEDPSINTLLENATRALGELNGFSLIVPNIDRFMVMHVAKEATASSRIEGTRTTLNEALQPAEQIAPEHRDDWQEVRNYILAMQHAIGELSRLPLCNRLLKEAHRTLMSNVRGEHKMPGDFRTSQNWIGGDSLEGASFIPPPSEEVPNLMSDLEKFWHNDAIAVPHLIRIAISHYQFETIHPFLDGNGRIGRLLIPLYLMSHGLLKKPSLYVSAHLEKNRQAYYDALTKVRMSNDLVHWIKFFLEAIHDTALLGIETFETILALRTQAEKKVRGLGARSGKGYKLLEHLYQNPSISRTQAAEALGVSFPTAASLLAEFVRLGLLQAMPGDARTRQYVFGRYLACFTAVRPRPATAAIANPPKLQ